MKPAPLADRIEHWDDERNIGNSLIVTLKPGFAFDAACSRNAEHVQGFDTVREARAAVRHAHRCCCRECAGKPPA